MVETSQLRSKARTLVIGDLHLRNITSNPKYLEAQVDTILGIFRREDNFQEVVFLGDVFHFRKPSPTELLAFKQILDSLNGKTVHILRGNHESETKADDGVTALTLFSSPGVNVYEHFSKSNLHNWYFIPHYENENTIIKALEEVSDDAIAFGHFGFAGCIRANSGFTSTIETRHFKSPTILGHIHKFDIFEGKIVVLGTPYSTEYSECDRKHYYGILDFVDGKWVMDTEEITWGLRHLVLDIDQLESNKDLLTEKGRHTLLRLYVNELTEDVSTSFRKQVINDYEVNWVDLKFKSLVDEDEPLSQFSTTEEIFTISDELIEQYVEQSTTDLPKELLMAGLRLLDEE